MQLTKRIGLNGKNDVNQSFGHSLTPMKANSERMYWFALVDDIRSTDERPRCVCVLFHKYQTFTQLKHSQNAPEWEERSAENYRL